MLKRNAQHAGTRPKNGPEITRNEGANGGGIHGDFL